VPALHPRRGAVECVTANKANAVVLWDGRTSLDVVPIRCVELDQSWDFPEPNTD